MNVESLISLAISDPGLSQQAKEFLSDVKNHSHFQKIISGAGGAALGVAIAKYKNLSKVSQILLGIAGFGIGTVIYDYFHKKNDFSNYNDKVKTYEINRTRY